MKKSLIILAALFLSFNSISIAQNSFKNTLFLKEGEQSPQADLSVIEWLAGHWQGEAFGGITEELWAPPLAGSMMGSFKLILDGQVSFYEIMTIVEENNNLILRLKHFHQDLKGWEEKDETHDFKLVKVSPDKVYFEGFTFEKIHHNEINIYVVIEDGENKEEVKFPYNRVQKP